MLWAALSECLINTWSNLITNKSLDGETPLSRRFRARSTSIVSLGDYKLIENDDDSEGAKQSTRNDVKPRVSWMEWGKSI